MKNFISLTILALVLWGLKLNAQTPVEDVVPNYYKSFYKISTHDGGVLDKRTSSNGGGNVYKNTYLNLMNQQWIVMPLKPNSADAVLVNRHGYVLEGVSDE